MVGRPSAASTTRLSDQMIRDCVVDGPKKKKQWVCIHSNSREAAGRSCDSRTRSGGTLGALGRV